MPAGLINLVFAAKYKPRSPTSESQRSKPNTNEMLSENILWARAINPANGRILREPTILGVVLIAAGLFAAFSAIVFLGSFL
jgi:hypothetical protein